MTRSKKLVEIFDLPVIQSGSWTQIEESLLHKYNLGKEELISSVRERLLVPREDGHHKKLQDPLPKIRLPHFQPFYELKNKLAEKCAAIKADRNTFKCIITAYDASG